MHGRGREGAVSRSWTESAKRARGSGGAGVGAGTVCRGDGEGCGAAREPKEAAGHDDGNEEEAEAEAEVEAFHWIEPTREGGGNKGVEIGTVVGGEVGVDKCTAAEAGEGCDHGSDDDDADDDEADEAKEAAEAVAAEAVAEAVGDGGLLPFQLRVMSGNHLECGICLQPFSDAGSGPSRNIRHVFWPCQHVRQCGDCAIRIWQTPKARNLTH